MMMDSFHTAAKDPSCSPSKGTGLHPVQIQYGPVQRVKLDQSRTAWFCLCEPVQNSLGSWSGSVKRAEFRVLEKNKPWW